MPDWFAYGAACTRRYRLLRQVQVVAYDELLCKEAEQLHARMHADCDAHYQVSAQRTCTILVGLASPTAGLTRRRCWVVAGCASSLYQDNRLIVLFNSASVRTGAISRAATCALSAGYKVGCACCARPGNTTLPALQDVLLEPVQPTDMDTATMVEFVRLMRWQHWQRWRLARKGFSAEPIQLVQRTSVECALCHHKNYLAYVLCDCHDGDPMCLNHREYQETGVLECDACLVEYFEEMAVPEWPNSSGN